MIKKCKHPYQDRKLFVVFLGLCMCLLLDFSFPMVIAEVDGSTKQEVAIDDEGTDTSKKADEQEGVVKRRKILPLKEARDKGLVLMQKADKVAEVAMNRVILGQELSKKFEKALELAYDGYNEAHNLLSDSLEVHGHFDFSKSSKDKIIEAVILLIAKINSRKGELELNTGNLKAAKTSYKLVQRYLYQLKPYRMVIWQKKVDKLREKSTAEIQTKFDNGDFDQVIQTFKPEEKDQKTQEMLQEAVDISMNMDMRKEGPTDFWNKQRIYTFEEQRIHLKSNLQLAHIFSKKMQKTANEEKVKALYEMAEEEYKMAKTFIGDELGLINFTREFAAHKLRNGLAEEALEAFDELFEKAEKDNKVEMGIQKETAIYTNYAAANFSVKNYDKCLELLDKAKEIDANNKHVHFYQVRSLLKLNRVQDALDYLQQVEQIYGQQEILEDLKEGIGKHLEKKQNDTADLEDGASEALKE